MIYGFEVLPPPHVLRKMTLLVNEGADNEKNGNGEE